MSLNKMNYEIREMQPSDGEKVIEIFQEGIDGGNAPGGLLEEQLLVKLDG